MSMTWMGIVLGALLLTSGTVALVALRLIQALRVIVQLEHQVVRLQEGTNLLTDTVELGFRQTATELERLATQAQGVRPPAPPARATTARVKAASSRGRSVREIAAQEQVSEGEVRLRLELAQAGTRNRPKSPSGRTPAKGRRDATLRA